MGNCTTRNGGRKMDSRKKRHHKREKIIHALSKFLRTNKRRK
jgi:hypothetical protein